MRLFRRGSTLLTVLLCLITLGLIGFSVSSALLSHYTLAVRYRDTAQMDALARAGVAEFIHRCSQKPPGDITTTPPPVLSDFVGKEVLVEPNAHLPGLVRLHLAAPLDSRDNTLSPLSAQSCFDSGSQQSIPPFSLDLVLSVELSGHTGIYEALVQQRWPYAVAAPGPIRVLGAAAQPVDFPFGNASEIKGPILAYESDAYKVPETMVENRRLRTEDFDLFKLILAFSPNMYGEGNDMPAVQVGDSARTYMVQTIQVSDGNEGTKLVDDLGDVTVKTAGAKVSGGIDIYRNLPDGSHVSPYCRPDVLVGEKSTQIGPVRKDYRLGGLDPHSPDTRRRFEHLFDQPDFSGWQDIDAVVHAAAGRDLVITSHSGVPNSVYVASGKARCRSFASGTGSVTLEDCSLACDGDLTLGQPGSNAHKVLKGYNATLVVTGQLLIDGGELDAGGKSMVVFADSFLIRASGRYNGLLVGRQGGAFYGMETNPNPVPDLVIHGGVLLGANRKSFSVNPVPPDDGSGRRMLYINGQFIPDNASYERSMRMFTLVSTYIEYDPQYMRGLNQFGGYRMQALLRRS